MTDWLELNFWQVVVPWALVWGGIGAIIGDAYKKQPLGGFVSCVLLGPVGFYVLVGLEDKREQRYWERWERETERVEKILLRKVDWKLEALEDRLSRTLLADDPTESE